MLTRELYRTFATREARGNSSCYQEWADGTADDAELCRLIDTLPGLKKQPNLVFAAARYVGVDAGTFTTFREALLVRWPEIRDVVLAKRTQTNEVGRLAVLLPVLASIPGPLALLEVGASAGLCLYPDKFSFDYRPGGRIDPLAQRGAAVLTCAVSGPVPIPTALPEVVWRAGIDLAPLDVSDEGDVRWLQTLVWPGQAARLERLSAAVDVARAEPPLLVAGDLNATVRELADQAPSGATLVIFHSAVLVYLSPVDRARFISTVTDLPGHWISNEGSSIDVGRAETLPPPTDPTTSVFCPSQGFRRSRLRWRPRSVPALVRLSSARLKILLMDVICDFTVELIGESGHSR